MTVGSPTRQILLFALPFLIGNVFQQLYNMADMIIVGRTMDSLAYAAVGSTGTLVSFILWPVQGLVGGFSAIVAQRFGAADERGIKQAFASSIKLSLIITVPMTVLLVLLCRPMLIMMRTPDTLIADAYSYLICIYAGIVISAAYNLLAGVIRALGDSRTPLYFLIIACVTNIILDFVFISLLGMGTAGAGLATVVAQLLSALLCVIYIIRKLPILHVSLKDFKTNVSLDRSLLKIGIPMAFLNMVISVGSMIVQFVTNGFGDVYVSSQVTGAKIEQLVILVLSSIASSSSVFASQNYGAQKYGRVLDGCKKTIGIAYVWVVIAPVIMAIFGKAIIRLVAGDVDATVVDNAYIYIIVNATLSVILCPLMVIKAVLPAVGITKWAMVSGFTEIVGRAGSAMTVIALTSLNLINDATGFIVMCFSNPIAWIFGFLTVFIDYVAMRKRFKRLIEKQAAVG